MTAKEAILAAERAGEQIGEGKENSAVSGSQSQPLYELAYKRGYFNLSSKETVLAKGPNSKALYHRNRRQVYLEGYDEGYETSLNASIESGISLSDIVDSVLNRQDGLTLENAKKVFIYSAKSRAAIQENINKTTLPITNTTLEFITSSPAILDYFTSEAAKNIKGFLAKNEVFCKKVVEGITTVRSSDNDNLITDLTLDEKKFLEASRNGETEAEKTFWKAAIEGSKKYPKTLHLVNHKLVRAELVAEMDSAALTTDGLTKVHLGLLAEQPFPPVPETLLADVVSSFLADKKKVGYLKSEIVCAALINRMIENFKIEEDIFMLAGKDSMLVNIAVEAAKNFPKILCLVDYKLVRAELIAEMNRAVLTPAGLTETHLDLLAEQSFITGWSHPLDPETVLADAVDALLADPNKIGYLKSDIICAALMTIMLKKRIGLLTEAEQKILAVAGKDSVLVQQAKKITLAGVNDAVIEDRPYGLANAPIVAMLLAAEMVTKVGSTAELSSAEMILLNEDKTHTTLVTELLKQAVQAVVSDTSNPKKQLSVFESERVQGTFVAEIIRQAQGIDGISVDYETVVRSEISLAKAVLRYILASPATAETKALVHNQVVLKMVCEMIVYAASQGPLSNACFVPLFQLAVQAGEIEALLATKLAELLAALVEITKKEHLTELSNHPIVQEALLYDIQKTVLISATSNPSNTETALALLNAAPHLITAAVKKVMSDPVDSLSHLLVRHPSVKACVVESLVNNRKMEVGPGVQAVLAAHQEVREEIAKEIYQNHRTESDYIQSPLATCSAIDTLISQERIEQLKSLQSYLEGSQHRVVEEAGKRFLVFKSAKIELPAVLTSAEMKKAQSDLTRQLLRSKK